MYVYTYKQVCMHVCVHVCEGQWSTSGVIIQELFLCFETGSLTEVWGSLIKLDLLAHESRGPSCPISPALGLQAMHHQVFVQECLGL